MVFSEKDINTIKKYAEREELIKQQKEMENNAEREVFLDGVMTSLELFMDSMRKYDELVKVYKIRRLEYGRSVKGLLKKHVSVYATGIREWDGPDWFYVTAEGSFYTGDIKKEVHPYWLKPFEYNKQKLKSVYINKMRWDKLPGGYNSLFQQMVRCTYKTERVYMDGCEECRLRSTELLSKEEIERNIKLLVIECAGGYLARQKAEALIAVDEKPIIIGGTTKEI